MKKILEVTAHEFIHGGVEMFITNTIQNMDLSDIQVDLVNLYCMDNNKSKEIFEKKKVEIHTFNLPLNSSLFNVAKYFNSFLKYKKYDIVHIHASSIKLFVALSLISKINGIKTVIVHSHTVGTFPINHYLVKMFAYLFFPFTVDNYCACSYLAGKAKFPSFAMNNCVILKNGIDLDEFKINEEVRNEYRNKCGFSNDDVVLGHVGRFCDEKNHEFIISLFYELRKKSEKYKLLLVGDGENMNSVKSQAEKLGVAEHIVFTGIVDNVSDWMQAMDIFVFPSKFEGLPFTAVEAQACGLPVVASTGVPDEMKLTDNVVFLPLDEKSEWISQIEEFSLLPKTDNTEQIRSAGYDINSTARQVKEMYLE